MKANRYYSVSFDERNYPEIMRLRMMCGGIVAYGRWEALKQILYDAEGQIDIKESLTRQLLLHELDFDSDEDLTNFIQACIRLGLLIQEFPNDRQVLISSNEVSVGIAYKRKQAKSGKKGGQMKAANKDK